MTRQRDESQSGQHWTRWFGPATDRGRDHPFLRFLDFASGHTAPDPESDLSRATSHDKGGAITRGYRTQDRRGQSLTGPLPRKEALQIAESLIDKDRAFACSVLDAAVVGKRELVVRLRQARDAGEIGFSGSGWLTHTSIQLVEEVEFVGDEIRFRPSIQSVRDRDQAILHMALAIVRGTTGEQTDVGRCQLESCRRFFVIQRGKIGRPQTDYCCEEHRLEQHNSNAAERQRRSRAKRKQRARQPRRAK